jgi:hypothetical protein
MDNQLEFKINVEDTPKEYIDGLILGLIHSGYATYFSFDNKEVCFTGFADEVITQEVKIIEN